MSPPTPGGIYSLSDDLVKFPDTDVRGTRTRHPLRTVVVMSSAAVCSSSEYGCVTIAPMSHIVTFCAGVDLIIQPNRENGLNAPGRVMISYMQPMVKSDLGRKIGVMSDQDWQAIMLSLIAAIDH
jgi:hypothetical protein